MRLPAPPRDAAYWRVPSPNPYITNAEIRSELDAIGYAPKKSASRTDLDVLLRHAQTDHICYSNCTFDELKGFAIDRGLISNKAKPGHARLISLLLKADMNPTFAQLNNLPPELRTRIYEFYLIDFTAKSIQHPIDPPLTRTNRLLRSEALPIFYQQCSFRIEISGLARSSLEVDKHSKAFLRLLSDLKLRNMRKLDMRFTTVFLTPISTKRRSRKRASYSTAPSRRTVCTSTAAAPFVPGAAMKTQRSRRS